MGKLAFLQHADVVRLDTDRIDVLTRELGPDRAEGLLVRATEELSVRLKRLRAASAGPDMDRVCRIARGISTIADQVGMVTVARVARDVSDCVAGGDDIAFRATHARLQRIGDLGLVEAICLGDQRI